MNTLFLSPHNDDAVLFGAFTIIRAQPLVITCFDSFVQERRGHSFANASARRDEDTAAMAILGADVDFIGIRDDTSDVRHVQGELGHWCNMLDTGDITHVWAPAVEKNGNWQHNAVGEFADTFFGPSAVTHYLTYTTSGKSCGGTPVLILSDEWIVRKFQALSCYRSQLRIDNCQPHFLRDQTEYYQKNAEYD